MTAVEFLLNLVIGEDPQGKDVRVKDCINVDEIIQAKEIDKEQKIKFAEHCLDKALDLDIRTAFSNVEQYYNETFKSE